MNKTEMAAKLAKKCDLSQAKAAEVIGAIFDTEAGEGIIAVELDAGDGRHGARCAEEMKPSLVRAFAKPVLVFERLDQLEDPGHHVFEILCPDIPAAKFPSYGR